MKIFHISDIHLNANATILGKLKIENGINSTYANRLIVLQWLINKAENEKADLIIISGDIFDKSKPFPSEYCDLIRILAPVTNKVHVIHGNHDEFVNGGCSHELLRNVGIWCYFKPFPTDISDLGPFIFARWGTTLKELEQSVDDCADAPILVSHCGIWSNNNKWVELDGESGNFSLEDIQKLGCCAVLLGHHHNQTELAKNIWYAGSPEIFYFGEENDQKGALIWTINGPTDVTVERVSTNHLLPPWKTFKPDEFLEYGNEFDGYVRVKGEVDEKERLLIIKKLQEFKCIDYKIELQNRVKKNRVFQLKGKSDAEILQNYLKSKDIKNVKELVKLDKEMSIATN